MLASGSAVAATNPATGTDFHPVTPTRVLDTRSGTGGVTGPVAANSFVSLDLSSVVPDAAATGTTVVLNVTAVNATADTFVTVYPGGNPRPSASSLNVTAGHIRANLVTVAPRNGTLDFYNRNGSVDLVADLEGYYTAQAGSEFTAGGPTRVLDTRNGTGTGGVSGPVHAGQMIVLDLSGQVPADATAVTLNLTALDATQSTFVTAWPDGTDRPGASAVNLDPGDITPNQVIVQLGPGGKIDLYNRNGTVDLVADLAGSYAAGPAASQSAGGPTRVLDTRNGTGTGGTVAPVAAKQTITLDLSGVVPPTATAVVLNLTGADGTAGTYVTAWAEGAKQPLASSLNLAGGQIAANLVTVPLSADNKIDLYNFAGSVDLIADVEGYFGPPDTTCAGGCLSGWSIAGDTGVRTPVSSTPTAVYGLSDVVAVAASGGEHRDGYALRSDGTVWSWGDNTAGGLDDGIVTSVNQDCTASADCWAEAPVHAVGLTGITAITAGPNGAFALRSDGTVWAFGDTQRLTGALATTPTQVSYLTGVTAIAAGPNDLYALTSNGTVAAIGYNDHGQLGNGNTGGFYSLTQVAGLTGVTAIAGGFLDGYAIKSDGSVWTWGYQAAGLATGTAAGDSNVPVQVAGLTNATAITANSGDRDDPSGNGDDANDFALVLRSDGTVWGFGYDEFGELGSGTHTARTASWSYTPAQVSGLSGVTAIGSSYNNGFASTSDGSAWAWGYNADNNLGNGTTTTESDTPVKIPGLTGITAFAGGSDAQFALTGKG